MDIAGFVTGAGGIAHRQRVLDAGASAAAIRSAVASGAVRRVRRYWVATTAASPRPVRGGRSDRQARVRVGGAASRVVDAP